MSETQPLTPWDAGHIRELMSSTYRPSHDVYVAIIRPLRAAKYLYTTPGKLSKTLKRAWRRAALRSARRLKRLPWRLRKALRLSRRAL